MIDKPQNQGSIANEIWGSESIHLSHNVPTVMGVHVHENTLRANISTMRNLAKIMVLYK